MPAIASPAPARLAPAPPASPARRRRAVTLPDAALYPREPREDKPSRDRRAGSNNRGRTYGQAIGALALPLGIHALIAPETAHAAGWYNDVQMGPRADGGFVGGGGGAAGGGAPAFGYEDRSDDYDYTTKDLAVDLASPLVAYKVVSWALNQEVPRWLDAITLAFTLAAVYAVLFDVTALDDRLQ